MKGAFQLAQQLLRAKQKAQEKATEEAEPLRPRRAG